MGMDKYHNLNMLVQARARAVWRKLQHIHPELVNHDVPTIKLNARLYRTAGRCFQELQLVELGTKFFTYNQDYSREMFQTIIPHEIIHAADFILYGNSDKRCGHGLTWRNLMVQYGLPPETHHQMWIDR